ncbi:MAG TPA: metallophosphoesterase [Gemmataceae bacterium]
MGVVVALLLAATAWFGHAFLMTALLNVWYALPLQRWMHKRVRALIALAVFGFPFAVAWFYGRQLLAAWDEPSALAHRPWLLGYLTVCWLTALVYVPAVTAYRFLRKPPTQVAECRGLVEDISKRLAEPPVGSGKHWRLARLPGNQCFQVEFRELTLRPPRLPPAWDGLTILHLTDLHFCGTPDRTFYQQVFDICLSAGVPDLLMITGDVVDSFHHHRWIVPLVGRLKWGVAAYAILGNHDKYHDPVLVRRRLRRIGVRVIGNGWERIDVRDEPLVVVGNEWPWFRPEPILPPVNDGGLRRPFRLCLSHTPDNFGWAQRNGIDLMLAGHVHGGQVRLPLLGSMFVPSRFSRRYDCGAFAAGPTFMYVSRGLAGREPLRYNCRPEVTRIILKNEPQVHTDEHR